MSARKVDVWGLTVIVPQAVVDEMERMLVNALRAPDGSPFDAVVVAGTPMQIAAVVALAEAESGLRVVQRSGSFIDLAAADFVILGTPIYFDAAGDSEPYGVSRRPKRGGQHG